MFAYIIYNIIGVPCYYSAILPKTKESCLMKAEKCYRHRDWPQTGSICDAIRCCVVFDNVPDLIQACVKFQHIVDRANQGGCIKRIIRVKNEFCQIPDKSWKINVNKFDIKKVQFNVLVIHQTRKTISMVRTLDSNNRKKTN